MQSEVFPDRDHFGRIFFNQATMSELGIPQIACVMGSCTAGGAYVPAMSDETVIVREQGTIFLGGPPLVKAATGEEVTAEKLGGGDLHARTSGVVDHLAQDDDHALEIVRGIVATLPRPAAVPWTRTASRPPEVGPETILDAVPLDSRLPYDVREVQRAIVDGSSLDEFKALYGETRKAPGDRRNDYGADVLIVGPEALGDSGHEPDANGPGGYSHAVTEWAASSSYGSIGATRPKRPGCAL
jgi:3-methylcrotonyl-CoA carboxylase beta subunit